MSIDLAEFVSDYMAIYKEGGMDSPPTSEDIAEAYLEATCSNEDVTAALIADVNYYRG